MPFGWISNTRDCWLVACLLNVPATSGACRCSTGSLDPRLIGSPSSLISPRKQSSLSQAHGQEMVKLTRGQAMVKLMSGQARGQANQWSSRAKSSNCEAGVNWPVVKCWSTDQWSSDGQTDQWSSYGQTDLWSSGNETDRTLWPTIDHWYVWPSIEALLCDNLTLGSNEPGIQWAGGTSGTSRNFLVYLRDGSSQTIVRATIVTETEVADQSFCLTQSQ